MGDTLLYDSNSKSFICLDPLGNKEEGSRNQVLGIYVASHTCNLFAHLLGPL